jgi:alkyl hydroperoxide reductase subunit AhpF
LPSRRRRGFVWYFFTRIPTAACREIEVKGIFVYIGQLPNTSLFKRIIEMDDRGYILGDEMMPQTWMAYLWLETSEEKNTVN